MANITWIDVGVAGLGRFRWSGALLAAIHARRCMVLRQWEWTNRELCDLAQRPAAVYLLRAPRGFSSSAENRVGGVAMQPRERHCGAAG